MSPGGFDSVTTGVDDELGGCEADPAGVLGPALNEVVVEVDDGTPVETEVVALVLRSGVALVEAPPQAASGTRAAPVRAARRVVRRTAMWAPVPVVVIRP